MRQTPNQVKKEENQMFLALVLVVFILMAFQFFTRQPGSTENTNIPETISQPTENSTLVADATPAIPTSRNTLQSETPTPVTMQPPTVVHPNKTLTREYVTSYTKLTDEPDPTVSLLPALNNNIMEYLAPVESTPFNEPSIVASTQLAQINETIIVNDLAREIPSIKNERTPPVYNLAMKIKHNIDNQRQNFFCFVQSIFISDQRNHEIAEAN